MAAWPGYWYYVTTIKPDSVTWTKLEKFPCHQATRAKLRNLNVRAYVCVCVYVHLTALFPGLPRWAGTRKVEPIWILLKQETVSGSGISRAVIDRARRHGYCSADMPSFEQLCEDADNELFGKVVRFSNHVLHTLLPPPTTASQNYNLRRRTHSLQLPTHATHLMDCTLFMRMLYKDTY